MTTTTEQLTARQRRILEFIERTSSERGYPPTVREIGEAVGLTSSSSVHSQLDNLQRKGMLHRDPTKPRAIMLDAPRPEGAAVPIVGRIAAGAPVLAEQHVEDYLTVPRDWIGDDADHFALAVTGDSMIGAGIYDGDTVIVRAQPTADEGDIVAALLPGPAEDEATVKRYHRDGDRVVLMPENPRLDSIEMTDGTLLGTVVAVLRKL